MAWQESHLFMLSGFYLSLRTRTMTLPLGRRTPSIPPLTCRQLPNLLSFLTTPNTTKIMMPLSPMDRLFPPSSLSSRRFGPLSLHILASQARGTTSRSLLPNRMGAKLGILSTINSLGGTRFIPCYLTYLRPSRACTTVATARISILTSTALPMWSSTIATPPLPSMVWSPLRRPWRSTTSRTGFLIHLLPPPRAQLWWTTKSFKSLTLWCGFMWISSTHRKLKPQPIKHAMPLPSKVVEVADKAVGDAVEADKVGPDARILGLVPQEEVNKVTNVKAKWYPLSEYSKFTPAEKAMHFQLKNVGKIPGTGPSKKTNKTNKTNKSWATVSELMSAISAVSAGALAISLSSLPQLLSAPPLKMGGPMTMMWLLAPYGDGTATTLQLLAARSTCLKAKELTNRTQHFAYLPYGPTCNQP